MSPENDSTPADLPSEWDALNMLDTLTSQLEDAVELFDLVVDHPDLVESGDNRLIGACRSLEQQLRVNVEELRPAQEILWHHHRQRRIGQPRSWWGDVEKPASAAKQLVKKAAKKVAKKKAKPVVKKARS
jgi:hypothetical protein